ncbi:MAG: HU family DNA-binding protein [Fusobacterium necrophorum]|nr:HU family DNA-binding protein [Fusobacterium necrophorum]MCI7681411.1 HU family DNA-binding protein [Fusobacterium necrophorum]MDY6171615.1 HU family DNA-binding protein [Fusobacterium necrophorum]
MTKKEFAKVLFDNGVYSSKAEAERNIDTIFSLMEECIIRDGSFSITNWGKLEVVERAPRLGRNPKTGEEVKIPSRKSIKFRPGKAFLEKLN